VTLMSEDANKFSKKYSDLSVSELLEAALFADVKEAMGCTEPVAIAIAAAKARALTSGSIETIEVKLSTNLLKNAMEVGIPGTGGSRGISLATALGALSGIENPDMSILESISEKQLEEARALVENGKIALMLAGKLHGLYVAITVTCENGSVGKCVISGSHENVVRLEQNGNIIFEAEKKGKSADKVLALREELSKRPFEEIWDALPHISVGLREYLLKGVETNIAVAQAGLESGGLKIGSTYNLLMDMGWMGKDVINRAKALTTAAVDARMSGMNLPVVTSAGSGNQGLSITLPLYTLAQEMGEGIDKLAEALAISHCITTILKHHTGTLSAMCGCVVCSGTGLAAGITYMMGGNLEDATAAVNNMIGSITGIICDGAKVGCAMKLVCAVDSAFQSAMMAINGVKLPFTNGIVGHDIPSGLANIGKIAAPGMLATDEQILDIMLGREMNF